MLIHGKERKFFLSVGATIEVAALCPDKDIKNIDDLMNGSFGDIAQNGAKLIAIMNKGYEDSRAYMEPGYVPDPLTAAEVLTLSAEDFARAEKEALAAFSSGHETTVEVEPEKKEKAPR